MSYAKLEEVAEDLRKILPTVPGSNGFRIDARKVLEQTLPKAGYNFHVDDTLQECAGFTVPLDFLVVLREDVYDGLAQENVFSRSTVIHELCHIVLDHAVTLQRGPIGAHEFFEDSEWQAKALTAAVMMPIEACRLAASAHDLAQICGTSPTAAQYRLDRLIKAGIIPPKPAPTGLF
ncbi:ImmA/IrrE family metallo-endopeptidase [Mitsuaria sp. TWR114]|uniref:ImmA/IrrE family metallo-endopeptidase n=1 Tax=Mitsuaria sp. TWR114 TaxID=2601731 RepID=UPI0011BE100E|nr:winged helix-turn-helix transcriptional regulator [Mitsuaria sp. TWR114]TXD86665.1 ImmA/IrrE family metallo-endopeptidase [Mitsuaria sp. TWR114]